MHSGGNDILAIALVLLFILAARFHHRHTRISYRPAHASYWLPWLGNALEYGRNPHKFLEKCRRRHGPIFTILLAGREITFLVEPSLIVSMFRNSKDLAFAPFRAEVQENAFATSPEGSVHPAIEDEIYPKAFSHFSINSMSSITSNYARGLLSSLRSRETSISSHISLWSFVFPTIYETSSKATFGDSFPESTFPDLMEFDEGFTFLVSHIPVIFIGRYVSARARLIAQLVDWTNANNLDSDVRPGTSELVEEAVHGMKSAAFRPSDIEAHLLSLLWGNQGNTGWTAFWFLVFVLQNPADVLRLREEIDTELSRNFGGSIDALVEADPAVLNTEGFILLQSGFLETMRMASAFIIARRATTDVTFHPRHIRPTHLLEGETLFVTPRNVHMNSDIYDDPQAFQLDRFVDDDGKSLRHFRFKGELVPNHLLLWGGGPHMCKGRHFAQYQVKLFMVLVLHLFDVEISHVVVRKSGKAVLGKTLPSFDERCIGMMHTNEDVVCQLTQRTHIA